MLTINIAKDFSKSPGGRYTKEGNFSGEQFREEVLKKAFEDSKRRGVKLIIDLDGGYGYGSSFLEEAFGGLARETKDPALMDILIISEEEPSLVDDVKDYIRNGLNWKQ